MENDLLLRDATPMDAPFIARVVLAGIEKLEIDAEVTDEYQPILTHLIDICRMDDTLYSYRHTRIVETGGQAVGALIGYDGGQYAAMRAKTFGLVLQTSGLDLNKNAMETKEGEFYLDSMAILPEFRGRKSVCNLCVIGWIGRLETVSKPSLYSLTKTNRICKSIMKVSASPSARRCLCLEAGIISW